MHRELEGGLVDVVEVDTPCVLTIQTGINEPRYATLRAIKQAEQKEIEVREPGDLGPPAARVRRMFVPPKGEGAEILDGDAASIARPDQGDRRREDEGVSRAFHALFTWGTPAHHPLRAYRRNPHAWRADRAESETRCDE